MKKEGDSLLLEEGFRVIAQDIIGHKIGVEIIHEARDGQTLDMFDREGKRLSSIEEAGIRDHIWKFEGEAKRISEQLSGVHFRPEKTRV